VLLKSDLALQHAYLRGCFVQKSLNLAAALGVTKFITTIAWIWSHLVVLPKSDLDVKQITLEAGWLNESLS